MLAIRLPESIEQRLAEAHALQNRRTIPLENVMKRQQRDIETAQAHWAAYKRRKRSAR